jgi:DNA-binding GntR family transcriptional regulator
MREFEMGCTPIREAIKRLCLENLVTVFPRRGTFASEITISDLRDVAELRVALEGHAACLAAQRVGPAEQTELASLRARLAVISSQTELLLVDSMAHRFVYRCTRNPLMEEELNRFLNQSIRVWFSMGDSLGDLTTHVLSHDEILDAIANGRAEQARDLASHHVAAFQEAIKTHI